MSENYYDRQQREAGEKLAALLALPMPDAESLGDATCFDPWELLPIYGSYDADFDQCALDVLRELVSGHKERDDLGAEMFREMLCFAGYCEYGTSPRVCFPTRQLAERLPELLVKWEAYALLQWPGWTPTKDSTNG